MTRMLVRNTVKDFDTWKAVFDEEIPNGKAFGLELEHLWRGTDDPNLVFFTLLVSDREKADAYLTDPKSAEVGERAGAIDGEVWYVE